MGNLAFLSGTLVSTRDTTPLLTSTSSAHKVVELCDVGITDALDDACIFESSDAHARGLRLGVEGVLASSYLSLQSY